MVQVFNNEVSIVMIHHVHGFVHRIVNAWHYSVKIPNQIIDKTVRKLNVLVGRSVHGINVQENVLRPNVIDVYPVHIMDVIWTIAIVQPSNMRNQQQLNYAVEMCIVQTGPSACGLKYVWFNVYWEQTRKFWFSFSVPVLCVLQVWNIVKLFVEMATKHYRISIVMKQQNHWKHKDVMYGTIQSVHIFDHYQSWKVLQHTCGILNNLVT